MLGCLLFKVLSHNPITKLSANAFSGLTNVDRLVLPSGIRTIEPDAFSGFEQVGILKLAFMDLPGLYPGIFRGLLYVRIFSIQDSDLGTIRPGKIMQSVRNKLQ